MKTAMWFATAVVLSVFATLLVSQQWRADAAPGDEDSTYVPIANCRLFDFRSGTNNVGPKNTPLGSGESNVYTQSVHGTNGDCTIPLGAVGVAMNVTIVNPTAQSNLRVFPADIATPNASNLNWRPGQSPTANKVDVKLSPGGKIKLFNHAGNVDVLGDVVGYYSAKSLKELAKGGFAPWDKIPSGQTVTGVFRLDTHSETDEADHHYTVMLPGRATSALADNNKINFASDANPDTADDDALCTGTVVAPTAPAGRVCLYLFANYHADTLEGNALNVDTDQGFLIAWRTDGTGDMYVEMSWAYTAP